MVARVRNTTEIGKIYYKNTGNAVMVSHHHHPVLSSLVRLAVTKKSPSHSAICFHCVSGTDVFTLCSGRVAHSAAEWVVCWHARNGERVKIHLHKERTQGETGFYDRLPQIFWLTYSCASFISSPLPDRKKYSLQT